MRPAALRPTAIRSAAAAVLGGAILMLPVGIPLGTTSPHLVRLALVSAVGLPWVLLCWFVIRQPSVGRLASRILTFSVIVFTTRFGMHQLGTYDVSSVVDLGWRYEQGQVPFRNFPVTLPPTFSATVRICWSFLGHSWASFVAGSALITAALTLCAWRGLSRTEFDSPQNEILVSAAVVIPHLAIGHIWHSAMASQIAVVTVVWLLAWKNSPSQRSAATVGVLLGLLALSKPNTAGPVALIAAVWMMFHWRSRHLMVLFLSFIASACAVLVVSKSDPLQLLRTTAGLLASRSSPSQLLPDGLDEFGNFFYISTYAMLILALVISIGTFLYIRSRGGSTARRVALLGLGSTVASLAGMATNWDIKSSDMPLAILGVLLVSWSAHIGPGQHRRPVMKAAVPIIIAILAVMNISIGSSRWRMELAGPMTQQEPTARLSGRVMEGVRAAPILQAVDQQLAQTLAESNERNVFLGPRLEIFYSRFNLESPPGLPLWWHAGTSYTSRDLNGIVAAFRSAKFSRAIFFKQDFTRFPPELRTIIDRDYEVDDRYSQLTIFWAKKD
jgi:hypothetical protein